MNLKEKLAAARRPERVISLCLRGDLAAEYDILRREYESLGASSKDDSLNAGSRRVELSSRMQAIREDMVTSSLDIRLQALPRTRFSELLAKCPPRDGNARDSIMGANEEDLVEGLIREGIVEPQLEEADWHALSDALTEAQYNELGNAAWELNKGPVSIPFLSSGSPAQGTSATA